MKGNNVELTQIIEVGDRPLRVTYTFESADYYKHTDWRPYICMADVIHCFCGQLRNEVRALANSVHYIDQMPEIADIYHSRWPQTQDGMDASPDMLFVELFDLGGILPVCGWSREAIADILPKLFKQTDDHVTLQKMRLDVNKAK